MILYHGSNMPIEAIDFSKSKPGKDFGVGFYLSADEQQMRNGSGNQTTEEVFDAIEQRVKNRLQADMSVSADHAIDLETMRERLHRMVHEVYSMP